MKAAGVRRIFQIMRLLQGLTAEYPNFSWHLHVTGHDTKGDISGFLFSRISRC